MLKVGEVKEIDDMKGAGCSTREIAQRLGLVGDFDGSSVMAPMEQRMCVISYKQGCLSVGFWPQLLLRERWRPVEA